MRWPRAPTTCSCSTTTPRSIRASSRPSSTRQRSRPDAGALSPKILFAEPAGLIWFAGAEYDPRSGYNGRHRGYREHDDGSFDTVVETGRVCGAAMLVVARGAREGRRLRPRSLRLQRGHRLVAARPRGGVPPLRRPGEPRLAQGLGRLGRRELADRALLRPAERARRRRAPCAARLRSAPGAGGSSCSARTWCRPRAPPAAASASPRRGRAGATSAPAAWASAVLDTGGA